MKLGVELSNDSGSYMLLDPAVSLAGILAKQNVLAAKAGQPQRDMIMVSVFTDVEPTPQQGGYQQQQQQHRQQPQQQHRQQPQQQQGGYQQQHQPVDPNSFGDDVPF